MEAIQLWFQPLLWIIGTVTGIGCFVRFCKPLWNFFKSPEEMSKGIVALNNKLTEHFETVDKRLNKFDQDIEELKKFDLLSKEVQQNLLRDRLLQGYQQYKAQGSIPDDAYRSLCEVHEVYQKCGGNSYADTVMKHVHDLYKNPKVG